MVCYCANYYGSVNCHNTVVRFGDRCAYCLATRKGASVSPSVIPHERQWAQAGLVPVPGDARYPAAPGASNRNRGTGS